VLAGTSGLDGGVQGQEVGLVGDIVDDADLLRVPTFKSENMN
jgi:hypothetical protein